MKKLLLVFVLLAGRMLAQSGPFAPSGGSQNLILNVAGGTALVGTTPTAIPTTILTLQPNTTNYVYVDLSAGVINFNTTGFTSTTFPVGIMATNGTQVVSFKDVRPAAWTGSGGGAPTGSAGGVLSGTYPNPGIANPLPVATIDDIANAGVTVAPATCSGVLCGSLHLAGGTNSSSTASHQAGGVELEPGPATAGGTQGVLIFGNEMTEGVGTVTQWNLECYTSSSPMTVLDCGANPTSFAGVTDFHTGSVTEIHIPPSETPINASGAVTLYHTVCAGSTAGQVTDSGGTGPCPANAGITVGTVIKVSGNITLPDGVNTTLSTTLPLVAMNARSQIGGGDLASAGMSSATAPILDTSNVAQFQASLLNYSGHGNGTSDNSTAMTNACAANSEVWLPAGAYAFTSSYALPCPLHFGAGSTLVAPQGVTLSNVSVSSAPNNVQLFTLTAGLAPSYGMTTVESPISDGGNFVPGYGASSSTAGQVVAGNKYEAQTTGAWNAALWTGSGVFPADQCSEVALTTMNSGNYIASFVRAAIGSTGYYAQISGPFGATVSISLQKSGSALGAGITYPISANDKIKICAVGGASTVLTIYTNGAVIPSLTYTDSSSPILSGYPGMGVFTTVISSSQIGSWNAYAIDGAQASGAVTMAANQTVTYPEWFGAAGNGSLGCSSATDDTVPIAQATNSIAVNGGWVDFAEKTYKITQAEQITANNVSWAGVNARNGGGSSILQCGPADSDILDITGPSASSFGIWPNTVTNMRFWRAQAGTNPSAAVRVYGAGLTHLEKVLLYDSYYLTYQSYSANSFFKELNGGYTYGTPSGSTAYYYSSANGGASSSICEHCWVSSSYYGTQPATDMTYYDFAVNSPASGGAAVYALNSCPADVHFIAPIWDGGSGQAVSLSGINATYCGGWQKLPSITIENLHATTNGTAPQIYIHNSSGVRIIGGDTSNDGMSSGYITAQIDGATSQGNLIQGLKMEGTGTCIELTGGANDNTIANNSCGGVSSSALTTGFLSTGSTNNTWLGNNVWGYFTTAFSFDSTSNNNQGSGNTVDMTHGTTRFSDAGAGNFKNWHDQGSCTVSSSNSPSGSCGAITLSNGTYSAAPICTVSWTGTGTLAGFLSAPSTTTTVTPTSSLTTDTAVVNWSCNGN